jgi:hypothetical protein
MSKFQKKPSALKREYRYPALHNMKFLQKNLLFWVIFGLPDPDPLT